MAKDYKAAFRKYPDVVTIGQLCKMIRISDGTARKLMQQNLIPHFYIRTTYYIPKQNVIDYLNSDHYKQYRLKLKNSI
ncbi:MAG: helix-turn-helix domain-containing protein [Clostridia bacterium]|nr:helix-turn-helix domain-containing protein [Clostridia bacterium]